MWRLESRGLIEGIGATPRLSARDGHGGKIADQALELGVRDQSGALEVLATWLRRTYAPARVLGVGHRVVHGGPKYAAPTVVTREVMDDLRALAPLAPLASTI